MAKTARGFFESDSEEDSVQTDSTAASEPQYDYQVEEILLETENEDGEKVYLIKWETYPLHRATWEPRSNISSDVILRQWERRKNLIKRGEAEPFDENLFNAAVEENEIARDQRKARRKKKRRRRGLAVSPDDTHDEHEAVPRPSPQRKKPRQAPVKRKGVAQKLERSRKNLAAASSSSETDTSSAASDDDSDDSLVEEIKEKVETKGRKPQSERTRSWASSTVKPQKPTQERRLVQATASFKPAVLAPQPASLKTAPSKPAPSRPAPAQAAPSKSAAPPKVVASTAARKTAPSSGTAGSVVPKDIFANWTDDKVKRRQRPRVSGETPKDSSGPKFSTLGMQGRYQKYSKNEKAPDINAVNFLDPKTGSAVSRTVEAREKESSAKQNGQAGTVSRDIPSAYSRRNTPPRRRTKSPTSPSTSMPPPRRDSEFQVGTTSAVQNGSMSRRTTCRYWEMGECRYTADTCRHAHYHKSSGKQLTCFFHHKYGKCKNIEAECDYAHQFTGIVADPPPGYSFQRTEPSIAEAEPTPPAQPQPTFPAERGRQAHHNTSGQNSQRRIPNKQKTCFFYHNKGSCKRSEDECDFAHQYTGFVADPPAGYLLKPDESTGVVQPTPEHPLLLTTFEEASRYAMHRVTCHFWRTSAGCTKPNCEYAHWDTGIHAPQPGTLRKASKASGTTNNANLIPLRTDGMFARRTEAIRQDSVGAPLHVNTNIPDNSHFTEPVFGTAHVQSPQAIGAPTINTNQSPAHQVNSPMNQKWNIRGAALQRQASFMNAILSLHSPEDEEATALHVKLEIPDTTRFQQLAGSEPVLEVMHTVMASDFEHLLWSDSSEARAESVFGRISVDQSQSDSLDNITSLCKARSAALVAQPRNHDSSFMLIFPGMAEEYKFLEAGATGVSSISTLHFRLFRKSLIGTSLSLNTPLSPHPAQVQPDEPAEVWTAEQLAGLDQHRFFPKAERDLQQHERAVFLIFPANHQTELEVYTKYFEGLNCKVYHAGMQAGAWQHFARKYGNSCPVIMHPEVPLWQIPGLHDISGKGSVFSIGVNWTIAMLEDREPQFGCDRLFPRGIVVFITDDVFLYHPEKAIEILEIYKQINREKGESDRNRLVARPGVKDWIFQLASDTNERGRPDHRWMRLFDAIGKFGPYEIEGPTFNLEDSRNAPQLITPAPSSMPDYNNKWERNQIEATDFLVDWFAGWSVLNASRYRVFMVCHEAKPDADMMMDDKWQMHPDPRGWAKRYQHIGVQLPGKVATYLRGTLKGKR